MAYDQRLADAEFDIEQLAQYVEKIVAVASDALALEAAGKASIPFSGNLRLAIAEWEAFKSGRENRLKASDDNEEKER